MLEATDKSAGKKPAAPNKKQGQASERAPGDHTQGSVINDRYRLERVLGTGGMGTVWLAHDQSLDTSCALKLIDREKAEDQEVRVRFEREAKASAQLRGAHVVDVFDYGVHEQTPFIAMELLEGEDLADRLAKNSRLTPQETYKVVAHVCRALARAHNRGIVHRDLKPENVFLVDEGSEEIAKVLDFGIAKHERYSVSDTTTKIGAFLGTPHYVSPEQARGEPTDGRSDLWAMAVIAFQCLTGRLPFWSESLGSLMGQILYEAVPVPSQVAEDVPPGFDAWWERAAKRRPEERFQDAQEFSDALAEALGLGTRLTVPSLPPHRNSSIPPPPSTVRGGDSSIPPKMRPATSTRSSYPSQPEDESRRVSGVYVPSERSARGSVAPPLSAQVGLATPFPLTPHRQKTWVWFAIAGVLALIALGIALSTASKEPTQKGLVVDAVRKADPNAGPSRAPVSGPVVAPAPEAEPSRGAPQDDGSLRLEDLEVERKDPSPARQKASPPTKSLPPQKPKPSFKPVTADYGI